jgi:molybdate transport system substrate-binding protein
VAVRIPVMIAMSFLSRLGCLLLLIALPAHAQKPAPPQVTVFAAASLKESLDAVAAQWQRRSGQKVVVSYAASSALAKQIEQDAPADIFISADREWMDYLAERKRIDAGSRFDLVGNRLVLIVPADSPQQSVKLDAASLQRALGGGRLAVADTGSVPAGRYAKQSLLKLGLWAGVESHLASSENVRAAMAFVARGECPLGIVYATDAKAEPKVRVVAAFPDSSHEPIIYPVAGVAGADPKRSDGLLAFLRSRQAQTIFRQAGFSTP